MTARSNYQISRKAVALATLAGAMTILSRANVTPAQEPIRIQTNEVLVPVFVSDKQRVHNLKRHPENLIHAILAGDTELSEKIMDEIVIRGLTAADFQVFEDGKKQAIRNVNYEPSLYRDVRDKLGHHTEYVGPGGGTWSTAEWPKGLIGDSAPPHYLIAYELPESPDGGCHQIKVTVNRPSAVIAARREYCNTKNSASDPLKGTKLGEQLKGDIEAPQTNNFNLSLMPIELYSGVDSGRVHLSVDWPGESLRGKARTKGILVMVFRKDGSFVTRMSDVADGYGVPELEVGRLHNGARSEINLIENHYDSEVNLPPGEYELRVALGDGTRFGKAEMPITVDRYDRRALGISAVALCKQISDLSFDARRLPATWTTKEPGGYTSLVSNGIEFRPTNIAQFRANETLYMYFEVYEPLREEEPQPVVAFRIRIVDLKTGELKSDPQPISANSYLKAGSSIIRIGRGIDISKIPKGSYRLDLCATDSTGKSTDWRSVNFNVE
jgi:hypothetical protein